jgi:hypothetical protein
MDDDAAQLRERIDKLEQVVAEQQQTIEKRETQPLLGQWGRRGVLGSIAAALGIASASGSAAAGVGDVGTASERVDIFADQADVNDLKADALSLTDVFSDLNKVASGTVTVSAGSDTVVAASYTQNGVLFGSAHQKGSSGGTQPIIFGGNGDSKIRVAPEGDGSGIEVKVVNDASVDLTLVYVVFEWVV